jgi:Domain of unknown function (DUF4384)
MKPNIEGLLLVLIIGAAVLNCFAQSASPGQDIQMRIVLEQQTGSTFRVVSPQHVFKTGDLVRFRVLSSSDGFLYVSDRAASGKYSELFPAKGSDTGNRLEHGREYRIPAASRSWFRIEKPPGYETVFFTFTYSLLPRRSEAAPIPATAPGEPLPQSRPAELIPRCDDALFRARGECLDVNAGPSAVPPGTLAGSDALTPRDVTIVPGPDISVVTPATPGDAPIIYEFRIAHR